MISASIAVFLLLCLSAFFSGSETSLTGASKAYMLDKEKNEDSSRAKIINKLFEKRDNIIITTLLGSNLANTLATSLSTSILISMFGNEGVAYATIIMTVLVLIYTDMLPKTYAVRNANKMALFVAPFIKFFVIIFSPLVYVLQVIAKFTFKAFGLKNTDNDEQMAISEIRGAINMYDGIEIKEEKEMLKSVLDLADVEVYDVMNHRKNLFSLDINLPTEEKIKALQKCPYSRVPLYQEKKDNIVGVLIVKNFLKECVKKSDDLSKVNLEKAMIKPWFIPDNTNLLQQLKSFKDRREHFAIVIDEYGLIQGIVTLEDILEEIVGDINDESDVVSPQNSSIKQIGNSFIVDGETTIRDLNRQNGWEISDDNMVTIAGYLIDMTRSLPKVGQKFIFDNFKFEIMERKKNQISSIKITKLKN
ncbi:MAG: CNNM domain-containing protein [Alphaproteobacteria bacterium]|nr:CNNM domain-containing protein [Alphaproteobacteria bacterium]